MKLTNKEQSVVDSMIDNPEVLAVVEKFFIRKFEEFPPAYKGVPNEELGAQVKAQLTARELNLSYLSELKRASVQKGAVASTLVPE